MAKNGYSENFEVMLHNVRLAYSHHWKPRTKEGQRSKYKSWFILDPDSKDGKKNIKLLEDAISAAKLDLFQDASYRIRGEGKLCLQDGDEWTEELMHGMKLLRATRPAQKKSGEPNPPHVLNRKAKAVRLGEPQAPYSGCYVIACVGIWAMDKPSEEGGKQVCCRLEAIQFYEDGDRIESDFDFDVSGKFKALEDDKDEDEAPRSKRRASRDEGEDEAPRSSRSRRSRDEDEGEEDEAPRSKRRASRDDAEDEDEPRSSRGRRSSRVEDDEEEAPRSRRRSRDEDEEDTRRSSRAR